MTPARWGWIALLLIAPLHIGSVCFSGWLVSPPKLTGDGPDYEAIGYQLSRGNGWSTHYSAPDWRIVYEQTAASKNGVGLDDETTGSNGVLHARGPLTADTNRPPLFPALIGIVYELLPRGPWAFAAVRVVNALFLALSCAIAVAWGVTLMSRTQLACVRYSAIVFAASLIAIVYSERNLRNYLTDFLTEPMATCLTMLFLYATWNAVQFRRLYWMVMSAIAFALMYFARSAFFLWLPGIVVWLAICVYWSKGDEWDRSRPTRFDAIKPTALFVLAFVLFASPWWIRNCLVLEEFSPLGTKGFTSFLGGFCDESYEANGEWRFAPERALRSAKTSHLDWETVTGQQLVAIEKEISVEARQKIVQWCVSNPGKLAQLTVLRVITEWNPYTGKALALKILALVGLIWLARHHREILIWLVGPLLISTLTVSLTYSVGGRFLVPTYGCIYILAAFGVVAIYAKLSVVRSPLAFEYVDGPRAQSITN